MTTHQINRQYEEKKQQINKQIRAKLRQAPFAMWTVKDVDTWLLKQKVPLTELAAKDRQNMVTTALRGIVRTGSVRRIDSPSKNTKLYVREDQPQSALKNPFPPFRKKLQALDGGE